MNLVILTHTLQCHYVCANFMAVFKNVMGHLPHLNNVKSHKLVLPFVLTLRVLTYPFWLWLCASLHVVQNINDLCSMINCICGSIGVLLMAAITTN